VVVQRYPGVREPAGADAFVAAQRRAERNEFSMRSIVGLITRWFAAG
jgi:hypothetical protein